jgi:hypothetical protein
MSEMLNNSVGPLLYINHYSELAPLLPRVSAEDSLHKVAKVLLQIGAFCNACVTKQNNILLSIPKESTCLTVLFLTNFNLFGRHIIYLDSKLFYLIGKSIVIKF